MPGWLLLVFGLAIGATAVVVLQLALQRGASGDGLASVFTKKKAPEAPATKKTADASAQKPAKPKFDFYTVLPEVETVLPERAPSRIRPTKPTASPEDGVSYILQAGSFASYQDADQLKAKLALHGLTVHIQKVSIEGRGEYHRVRLGPYAHLEELDQATQQLRKLGINALRLKVNKGGA